MFQKNQWQRVLVIGLILAAASWAAVAGESKGISTTKPASGPFVDLGDGRFMVPYTETVPGTEVKLEMIPIPGGKFLMGSPEGEADRNADEGPQVEVAVEPFWMGKYELTWAQYQPYMKMYDVFKKFEKEGLRKVTEENKADAVTIPTPLYDASKTYERGDAPSDPAVTMTPYAAMQYTKWLSLQLGDFFRLPSEAEWEYAARGGTKTAFYFGDDAAELEKHGWYYDNSFNDEKDKETYRNVGAAESENAFGLFDMHGNVSELVLDEYVEDHYTKLAEKGGTVDWKDAVAWPTQRSPRVHRGGSWFADAKACRSAARGQTDDEFWRLEDPNTPKSPWWYTEDDGQACGMRLVRPLKAVTDRKEQNRYWDEHVEDIQLDIKTRLTQGRATHGPVDADLPKTAETVKD